MPYLSKNWVPMPKVDIKVVPEIATALLKITITAYEIVATIAIKCPIAIAADVIIAVTIRVYRPIRRVEKIASFRYKFITPIKPCSSPPYSPA